MSDLTILDRSSWEKDRKSQFGSSPQQRNMKDYIRYGFIILDKPVGPTSHDVVATVKKILGISKAGHLGTLDPNVSGVLLIALEKGTKILSVLKGAKKEYICNLFLHDEFDKNKIYKVIDQFENDIYQVPPLKSNVAKKLRTRTIYSIKCLEFNNREVLIKILCEAGTYIRTLCRDIGRAIGTTGVMKELRRIKSGTFSEQQTVTLHDIFDANAEYIEGLGEANLRKVIQPIESLISHLPSVILRNRAVNNICHGMDLRISDILAFENFEKRQTVALKSAKEELVALGNSFISSSSMNGLSKSKIIHPNSVIMKRDTYPTF